MKAEEIRIGNLVNYGEKVVPIKSIHTESILRTEVSVYIELNENLRHYCVNIDEVTPIPLTEQWLLDFGFEKIKNKVDIFEIGRIRIWMGVGGRCLVYIIEENTTTGHYLPITIEYVHTLQNLFYALTGQELELNKK